MVLNLNLMCIYLPGELFAVTGFLFKQTPADPSEVLPKLLTFPHSELQWLNLYSNVSEEGALLDEEIEAEKAGVLAAHNVAPPVRVGSVALRRINELAFPTCTRASTIPAFAAW